MPREPVCFMLWLWQNFASLHRVACWRMRCAGRLGGRPGGMPVKPTFHASCARSLAAAASGSLVYSQHRAKRQDVAKAFKGRGVQARGAATVKKQRIGAIHAVTE